MRRLAMLAFIWGWSFLFIKVAVQGMTPSTVAWGRIALGALVLNAVLHHRGDRLPRDRVALRHFTVTALAGTIAPFTLLAYAEQHVSSALTSVLNASTPLFTAAFAALALSERLRPLQLAGLATGITGVAVAAGLGASDLSGASLVATIAGALAGAGYGISFNYMRRHLMGMPPLTAAAGQLAVGTAIYWPVAAWTSVTEGLEPTPTRVLAIVLLGALGTGLAFVMNYGVVAELGATAASLVTYLVPVVAVVVGVVVLGEDFGWRLLVGGGLTILGVAAVNHGPPSAAPATRPKAGG